MILLGWLWIWTGLCEFHVFSLSFFSFSFVGCLFCASLPLSSDGCFCIGIFCDTGYYPPFPPIPPSPSCFHLVWFPSFPSALQMKTQPSILSTFSPPPTTQLLRGCSRKSAMSPLVLSEVHLKDCAASARVMKNASFKHWGCCRLSRHRQRHRLSNIIVNGKNIGERTRAH